MTDSDRPNPNLGPTLNTYTRGLRAPKLIGAVQGMRFKVPWNQTQAVALALWLAVGTGLALLLLRRGVWPPIALVVVVVPGAAIVAVFWRHDIEGRQPAQAAVGVATLGARRPQTLVGSVPRQRPVTITVAPAITVDPEPEDS